MNQTHIAEEPYFQNILETDAMPRQNNLTEQEESFLSAYANMLLHKRLREEKMLSPCACPFSLITDANQFQTETQWKKILNDRKVQKKDIASQLNKSEDKIQLKDENKEEEKDWKETPKVTNCRPAPTTKSNAIKQKVKENYYDALQTDNSDAEGEEDCEPRRAQTEKEMIKDKEETYDANEMMAEENNRNEKEDHAVEEMTVQEMKRIMRDALGAEKDEQKEVDGATCDIAEIFLGECVKEHQCLENMHEERDKDARETKLWVDRKIEQMQMLKEEIESKEQKGLVKGNEHEENAREHTKELKALSEDDRNMAE